MKNNNNKYRDIEGSYKGVLASRIPEKCGQSMQSAEFAFDKCAQESPAAAAAATAESATSTAAAVGQQIA